MANCCGVESRATSHDDMIEGWTEQKFKASVCRMFIGSDFNLSPSGFPLDGRSARLAAARR